MGRFIQCADALEHAALHCFAIVILDYAPNALIRLAYHDIPQSNVGAGLGAPPPMPAIKPIRTDLKLDRIEAAAATAEVVLYTTEGIQAMTILWTPICPRV